MFTENVFRRPIMVYDVEVLHGPDEVEGPWENPEAMGFGTAVVYDYAANVYRFYGPDQKQSLIVKLGDTLVVSFNGIKFDNAVVLGNEYESAWYDYDLLQIIVGAKWNVSTVAEAQQKYGSRELHDGSCGLDAICRATFNMQKIGHGSLAPKMIHQERWPEVFQYNLHDVRMTRRLAEHIRDFGYVIDGNGVKIIIPNNNRLPTLASANFLKNGE